MPRELFSEEVPYECNQRGIYHEVKNLVSNYAFVIWHLFAQALGYCKTCMFPWLKSKKKEQHKRKSRRVFQAKGIICKEPVVGVSSSDSEIGMKLSCSRSWKVSTFLLKWQMGRVWWAQRTTGPTWLHSHGKEFEFYSMSIGEPLECVKQVSNNLICCGC